MTILCNEPGVLLGLSDNHCSKVETSEKNVFTFSRGLKPIHSESKQESENNMKEAESVHHKTGNGGTRISLFFEIYS